MKSLPKCLLNTWSTLNPPLLDTNMRSYVYYSYEEWGRGYLGVRSCPCAPELDMKYLGSFRDKSFKPTQKIIIAEFETREGAMEAEIKLHDFFDVGVNPNFANLSKSTSTGFDKSGVPCTEETKQKMSKPKSDSHRKNISIARTGVFTGENHNWFGNHHKPEAIEKCRAAKLGDRNPAHGKHWWVNPETNEETMDHSPPDSSWVRGRKK